MIYALNILVLSDFSIVAFISKSLISFDSEWLNHVGIITIIEVYTLNTNFIYNNSFLLKSNQMIIHSIYFFVRRNVV